jgi:hypothetical protein
MLESRFPSIVALVGVIGFLAPATADEPPVPKKSADPAEAIRRAAKEVEVHGVGVSEPAARGIGVSDVTDWPALVRAIRDRRGPGGRIWELLSKETRDLLTNDKVVDRLGDPNPPVEVATLRFLVAMDLTKILDRTDFYTEEAFRAVFLNKDLKAAIALGPKRTPHQTACLNRALLAAAFPDVVTPIPPRFQTVRVQVVAGKDVVLVLSSYNACRWEVEVRPGGKVAGVVLCGYHTQEVTGVDAPVVYRAYYRPDGKPLREGDKYFYGFDVKDPSFKDFAAAVKELTGREFTTFQGEYTPGPFSEPYTVRPVGDR